MIRRLYEAVTGQPWTTTRSMAAEFGPPPAVSYAEDLAAYTDAELIERGPEILDQMRERYAAIDRLLTHAPEVVR